VPVAAINDLLKRHGNPSWTLGNFEVNHKRGGVAQTGLFKPSPIIEKGGWGLNRGRTPAKRKGYTPTISLNPQAGRGILSKQKEKVKKNPRRRCRTRHIRKIFTEANK